MENLEALAKRGLRAYELGRLRMALRVGLVLIPAVVVCLLEPVGRVCCAGCGVLLLGAAVWLRFRDRVGVESVTSGLLAGAIPLVAGLALVEFDPGCAAAPAFSCCTLFSVLVGGAAGAVVALREASAKSRSGNWLLAAGVAALAASLGCIRLGLASVLAVTLGIVVGRAATPNPARVGE